MEGDQLDLFTIAHILFKIPSHGFGRLETNQIGINAKRPSWTSRDPIKSLLFKTLGGNDMKKRNLMVVGLVLSLSVLMAGSAFARWGDGNRGGYDCNGGSDCYQAGQGAEVDIEALTRFQKETLQFRDELLTKRLELSQEYDKENPDADQIAKLRKEIVDVETSIAKVADKYDIDNGPGGRRAGKGGRGGNRGGSGCSGPGNCF